jgi:hypothetical protein
MDKKRLEESIAVTVGLLVLFALPAISHTQSALISSASTQTPIASAGPAPAGQPDNSRMTMPAPHLSGGTAARPTAQRDLVQIEDYTMSLMLTDDQKAQIGQIHQEMKNRMDLVAKDTNETIDQKEAMIDGLKRMRLREVLLVLTPEQRSELRKKLPARSSDAPPQGTRVQQASPK